MLRFMRNRRENRRESDLTLVKCNTLEVRDLPSLQLAMGWRRTPRLSAPHLHRFEGVEDLNQRRLHDAEVVLSACCNGQPRSILEIGTGSGEMTALMAQHAPHACIRTVSTAASETEVGRAYKQARCVNVEQIVASADQWEPSATIDVAFINGCHDVDAVYSHTRKILRRCRCGSVILWQGFAPQLAEKFESVAAVCRAVERLYRNGVLQGRVLHLQDSWVGLYRVPGQAVSLSEPLPQQTTSAVAVREAA